MGKPPACHCARATKKIRIFFGSAAQRKRFLDHYRLANSVVCEGFKCALYPPCCGIHVPRKEVYFRRNGSWRNRHILRLDAVEPDHAYGDRVAPIMLMNGIRQLPRPRTRNISRGTPSRIEIDVLDVA